jgi:hypothetical protein
VVAGTLEAILRLRVMMVAMVLARVFMALEAVVVLGAQDKMVLLRRLVMVVEARLLPLSPVILL